MYNFKSPFMTRVWAYWTRKKKYSVTLYLRVDNKINNYIISNIEVEARTKYEAVKLAKEQLLKNVVIKLESCKNKDKEQLKS